jgi:hypothetical protein
MFDVDAEGVTDQVLDQLGALRTTELRSQFNHITIQPEWPDTLRWETTLNGGSVGNREISATGSGQNPRTRTRDRANYAPGSPSVFGMGGRVIDEPTGDQVIEWGGAEQSGATDGVGFGKDSTGPYVWAIDGGTKKKIYQTDEGNGGWNGNSVRGFEGFSKPRIMWVDHLWYRGGPVAWRVLDYYDTPDDLTLKTIHVENPPVFDNPNQPMFVEVDSGTDSSNCSFELDAVHYLKSEEEQESRPNGQEFKQVTVGTTGWTHLASFRKKTGWEPVETDPARVSAVVETNPVIVQVTTNPTLSSTSYSEPPNTPSSETAVEATTAGTIDDVGDRREVFPFASGEKNASAVGTDEEVEFRVPENQPVTLSAQAIGGEATVSGVFGWKEAF